MTFHITITDNETGETIIDQDTTAIIGACDNSGSTQCISLTDCGGCELFATVGGAMEMAETHLQKLPKGVQRFVRKTAQKEARRNA